MTLRSGGSSTSDISAAILAELMWDPDADLDTVLDAVFHDSRNAI